MIFFNVKFFTPRCSYMSDTLQKQIIVSYNVCVGGESNSKSKNDTGQKSLCNGESNWDQHTSRGALSWMMDVFLAAV